MASEIIHLAVASEVYKFLNYKSEKDKSDFLLGSIAPDVAKQVGLNKSLTHFSLLDGNLPNFSYFIDLYHDYLDNSFELGYYVHLLTDYLWYSEFTDNFFHNTTIRTKNNEIVRLSSKEFSKVIYNDYSSLNIELIDEYNLNFDIFYNNYEYPISHIKECKQEYFPTIIDKLGYICSMSNNYSYVFDIDNVSIFIDYCKLYVLDNIRKLNIDKIIN